MKILFFDFETTGFNVGSDKVIEIAAVLYDEDKGTNIDTFQTFIDPGMSISELITNLTGISNQTVKNAPTEMLAFERFAEFIKKHKPDKLAGHNIIAFDMRWMQDRDKRYKLNLDLSLPLIDTLPMVKSVASKGLLVGYDFKTATGRPSFKMEYLMKYFDLGSQSHRAIDDVINNIVIYKNLRDLELNDTSLGF